MTHAADQCQTVSDLELARLCLDHTNPATQNRAWAALEARHKASILRAMRPLLDDESDCENQWQTFVIGELERPGRCRLASFIRGAERGSKQNLGGYLATCMKHEALATQRRATRERNLQRELHATVTALRPPPAQEAQECEPGLWVPTTLIEIVGGADPALDDPHIGAAKSVRALSRARREHLQRALAGHRYAEENLALLLFFERIHDLVFRAAEFAPPAAARTQAGRRLRHVHQRRLLQGLDPNRGPSPTALSDWSPEDCHRALKRQWGVSIGAVWAVLWCYLARRRFTKISGTAIVIASFAAQEFRRNGALDSGGHIRDETRLGGCLDWLRAFREGGKGAMPFAAEGVRKRLRALLKARERAQLSVCAGALRSGDPALCAGIRFLFGYWKKNKGEFFDRHLPVVRQPTPTSKITQTALPRRRFAS